jgi:4-hydroxybenzoate polyprenyltransferase
VRIPALLRAIHFGPTLLVCLISFVLSVQILNVRAAVGITFAIFFGQCFVGWSNDLLDFQSDRDARRTDKPLVSGELHPQILKALIPLSLLLAILVSLLSPLHVRGTLLHFGGLMSATLYNVWLKRTLLSFVPYLVSFALLSIAIYVAAGKSPPIWLIAAFAIVSVSFHFFNVLKDMEEDRRQGLMGLPQRVGRRPSQIIASALLLIAMTDIVFLR